LKYISFALSALALSALSACGPQAEKTEAPPTEPVAEVTAERTALATVDAPLANARVTSPLIATGAAPADWIFEAVFAAKLIGADGATIAEGPAQSQDDWTNGNPTHPFRAELAFTVTQDTPATLVLEEDMPQEGATPREVRVPVILTAR
jgi:hypothetical protein